MTTITKSLNINIDRQMITKDKEQSKLFDKTNGYTFMGAILRDLSLAKADLNKANTPTTLHRMKSNRLPKWTIQKGENGHMEKSEIYNKIEHATKTTFENVKQFEQNLKDICINLGITLNFFGEYKS